MAGIAAGLLLHTYTSLRHYKGEAQHLLDTIMALEDDAYIEKIFRETKRIYESLPEDVRADQMSEEFFNAFNSLVDDDFLAARDILVKFREETEQRNMFLMFTDKEHEAVVYVVDGDVDQWAYLPGQWTEADIAETEAIADSSWRLALTHQDEYGWIGSDAELAIATSIQMGLLPDEFPSSIEYDLFASMDPAKEVGGDLYDFFMIDDTHLALVIADVSGKGISAALFMVVAKTLIRNLTELEAQDPAQVFTCVNRKLLEVNRAFLFVTAWIGILDLKSGKVAYVNAGHEYPAIRRAGGKFVLFRDTHSIPLAVSESEVFRSLEFTLKPGDTLFVYTDGVPEAKSEAGELMGTGRMLKILNRLPDASPVDVIENMKAGLAEYVKTAEQFDDTTMLWIRFNGCDNSERTDSTEGL